MSNVKPSRASDRHISRMFVERSSAVRSEDVTQCEAGRVVGRLYPVLDLQSKRLPDYRPTERQMTIAIEEHGGIAPLTRPVIDSNATDDP